MIVRRPRQSERIVCRMLLPEAAPTGHSREFRLGVDDAGGWIVGAVSFQDTGEALVDVRAHVVPTERRRGAGRRLLQAVVDEAAARGRQEVVAVADPTRERIAPTFLASNGFEPRGRLLSVEADLETACQALCPTKDRVLARHGLPPSVRVETLAACHLRTAADLYADYIAHSPELRVESERLGREFEGFDLSNVLLVGERVEAMILGERRKDAAVVHAWIVRPGFRGGGGSAVLVGVWLERARDAGLRLLQFETADTTRDTMKVVERVRGRVVRSRATFVRAVGAD
jgi:GNAT superfamily N-acetyltransferase